MKNVTTELDCQAVAWCRNRCERRPTAIRGRLRQWRTLQLVAFVDIFGRAPEVEYTEITQDATSLINLIISIENVDHLHPILSKFSIVANRTRTCRVEARSIDVPPGLHD